MILVGIKLFLRADELLRMRVSDFVQDLIIVSTESGVRSLGVTVKGKADTEPQQLLLWSDDDCLEFDPIRHFCGRYIKYSGSKPI